MVRQSVDRAVAHHTTAGATRRRGNSCASDHNASRCGRSVSAWRISLDHATLRCSQRPSCRAPPAEPVPPRAAGLLFIACIALAPPACTERSAPSLAAELGAAVAGDPPGGPRLSIPTRPCAGSRCTAAPAPPRVLLIARRASTALADSARADALHASALVDLVWGRGGIPLDRSIQSLRTASRLSASPAPILGDLAAALLTRAERTGSARDQFEALDAAEAALFVAPGDPAAQFNAALAADRLGLADAAAGGWSAAAATPQAGNDADWARLARRQRDRPPPRVAGPDRRQLRELGWDRLLGEWGAATVRGDSAVARRALARADSAARVLGAAGGDASLHDAVRAIRWAADDPAATRRLARGHTAYAHARSAFEAGRREEAADSLASATRLRPGGTPLQAWASVLHAAATAYQGRYEASERELDACAAGMDTLRHPALVGRGAWVRATIHLRTGRYESARSWAQVAERHLARAGEREYAGAARAVAADAAFALGDADDVYTDARRALTTLRPFRRSVWLHNALAAVSLRAAEDGMPGAALRMGWEDVRVASGTGNPIHLAEAHLVRARVAMSVGHGELARAETSAGAAALARAARGPVHDWLSADRQLARAFTELGTDPLRASAALDSAFSFFAALRNPFRALPLLVARGEARLASGDARGAADLERATASIAALGRGVRDGALAATLLDAARPVFDRAVSLRLARADTVGALLALERGRTAFGRVRRRGNSFLLAPRGPTVVYGVVGDTIFTWVVVRGTARMHRQRVPQGDLARSAERLRWALERGIAPVAGRELDRLARWLLHPVEPWIGPDDGEVTVVTDGELASVPFAALPARSGRRWIEDHPLRRAASLADAALPRPSGRPERVLLVADPAFDRARHPGLARLPGARKEVEEAAREYPRREVLSGADATRDTFLRALRSADVVHFAGHAVWDGGSPKRSWLVMAPDAGGGGRISAEELGGAGLEGVRLVVLSSCHTVGSGEGRMGGFAGFAGSLLSGGADGVVGSLWRVDDNATRVLMREFHLAYRASGDAPDALRRAQLALLRSADVRLRTPSAWAGFVYAGS